MCNNKLPPNHPPYHTKLSKWWEWIRNLSCRKINKQLFMFRTVGQSNRTRELIIKQPSKPEPRYIDNQADRHEIIMIGHVLTADHTPPFIRPPNFRSPLCKLGGLVTLREHFRYFSLLNLFHALITFYMIYIQFLSLVHILEASNNNL